jgi:hypothetical protein
MGSVAYMPEDSRLTRNVGDLQKREEEALLLGVSLSKLKFK